MVYCVLIISYILYISLLYAFIILGFFLVLFYKSHLFIIFYFKPNQNKGETPLLPLYIFLLTHPNLMKLVDLT